MKQLLNKVGAGIAVLPVLLLPSAAFAQISSASSTLGEVGSNMGVSSGTGAGDLPTLIANIINVLLSIVGVILVCFIVYAGFLYMTAGGDTDKVKKAKQLITQCIIGIIIIVAAYAISTFVIDQITAAAS